MITGNWLRKVIKRTRERGKRFEDGRYRIHDKGSDREWLGI
jgi:hypothetical protein